MDLGFLGDVELLDDIEFLPADWKMPDEDPLPSGGYGECAMCGDNGQLIYRPGLDLFLCFPCHQQPNIGGVALETVAATWGIDG